MTCTSRNCPGCPGPFYLDAWLVETSSVFWPVKKLPETQTASPTVRVVFLHHLTSCVSVPVGFAAFQLCQLLPLFAHLRRGE